MSNQERVNSNPEYEMNPEALEKAGLERRQELEQQYEKSGEASRENLNDARQEALEKATSAEKEKQQEHTREASPAERRRGPISKSDRDASYKATMSEIQTHMSPASRTFSKVIHNKTVERISEAAGNTIARPNAILSGAVFAFVLTLGVYLVAKNLGYPLSGFETIGAFLLGWVLGLTFDFIKTMVTGRK